MGILSSERLPWTVSTTEYFNRSFDHKLQIAAILLDRSDQVSVTSEEMRDLSLRASILIGHRVTPLNLESNLRDFLFSNLGTSEHYELSKIDVNPDFRDEIRGLTRKIRGVLNTVELDENVRHLLIKRLNAFENDLDRTRTRLDSFFGFFLSLTKVVGQGADNLEPAVRLSERVSGKLAYQIDDDEIKQIEFKKPDNDNE